jgi:hypothetical protein
LADGRDGLQRRKIAWPRLQTKLTHAACNRSARDQNDPFAELLESHKLVGQIAHLIEIEPTALVGQ